eukprot:c26154_g1_i1 orf=115-1026(-)
MGAPFVVDADRLTLLSAIDSSSRQSVMISYPIHQSPSPSEHPILISADESCHQPTLSRALVPSQAGLSSDTRGSECTDNVSGECRICQEEDDIVNLETPCACSGSLKYAHRKCVQRWCNEKGDTACEICHQPYRSGYTASAQPSNGDDVSVDLSEDWGIPGVPPIEVRDPRILAVAAAQRHFLEAEFDEYDTANSGCAVCCRSIALIVMALLLLRHALWMASSSAEDEDTPVFFTKFLLRGVALILPCYIIACAMDILQRRRHRQEAAAMAAGEVATIFLQHGQAVGTQLPLASASSPTNELP